MSNGLRVQLLALCAASALACADRPIASTAPVEWRLSEKPILTIGGTEGDDRYMLTRVVGVLFMSRGRILVAHSSLALFDSTGVFLKRVGGKGSGPGEFELLWHPPIAYRGDSIVAWDFAQRRLTVFDSEGMFGRIATVEMPRRYWADGTIPSSSCCTLTHAFTDGSFVLSVPAAIPTHPGPPRHATTTLLRIAADGAITDTIGNFPDRYFHQNPKGANGVRGYHLSWPFDYTVVGDALFGGNGETSTLQVLGAGGRRDSLIVPGAGQPVTPELKSAIAQSYRAEYARNPRIFEGPPESLFEGEYMPNTPAFVRVTHDPSGNLWLTQWKVPFSDTPMVVHVHSGTGELVARLPMPANALLLTVGRDRVALAMRDSLDVQRVEIYGIVR